MQLSFRECLLSETELPRITVVGSSANRANESHLASENVVRAASCKGVYLSPLRVRNSHSSKLTGRTTVYVRAKRRAADPGTTGHRRPRELERRGARGARQVLFTTNPGRRC